MWFLRPGALVVATALVSACSLDWPARPTLPALPPGETLDGRNPPGGAATPEDDAPPDRATGEERRGGDALPDWAAELPGWGEEGMSVEVIAPGVLLGARVWREPRPVRYWVALVRPSLARPAWVLSEPDVARERLETTRAFAERRGLALAVNAHFYAESGRHPSGMEPLGWAFSEGSAWSGHRAGWNELALFGSDGTVRIASRDASDEAEFEAEWLTAGIGLRARLLRDGEVVAPNGSPEPRTALGVTADGDVLVLVADGRQPQRSEGMEPREVGEALLALGAVDAVNLDGGGSSTLVVADPEPRVVNTPVGLRFAGTERAVVTSVGLRIERRDP